MLAHERHLDAAELVDWEARLAQPRRWLVVFHCTPSRLAGVLNSMRHSKVMVDEEVVHDSVSNCCGAISPNPVDMCHPAYCVRLMKKLSNQDEASCSGDGIASSLIPARICSSIMICFTPRSR